jgi:heptosyltransferase-2
MRILIVGPAWVGDMVMAQTLFICLKQQNPQALIDVLAPAWCRELLTRMPEVNQALALPIGHGELALGKRWRIARTLAQQQYTQAIVLPNSFKSALVPRFAGIPLRTGWRGEARGWLLNDCRRLDKVAYPLMVQRFAALAYAPGAALPHPLPRPALLVQPQTVRQVRERLQLASGKPVLVLCPGAEFGPAKQWPVQHYTAVARHFLAQGMQVWLMGSSKDSATAAAIVTGTDRHESVHDLCGRTALGEAVDLLSAASAVVSNDSGLMHVAAALARPLVVGYGSTSAAFTPPLAERVRCLSLQLSCSPCFKRECPLGHLNCLRQLDPDRVITAVNELLIPA